MMLSGIIANLAVLALIALIYKVCFEVGQPTVFPEAEIDWILRLPPAKEAAVNCIPTPPQFAKTRCNLPVQTRKQRREYKEYVKWDRKDIAQLRRTNRAAFRQLAKDNATKTWRDRVYGRRAS